MALIKISGCKWPCQDSWHDHRAQHPGDQLLDDRGHRVDHREARAITTSITSSITASTPASTKPITISTSTADTATSRSMS